MYRRRRRSSYVRRPRPIRRRRTRRTSFRRRRVARRPPTIAPRAFYTKLKFMDYYTLSTGGVSASITRTFRHNGVYDPDYTGAGGACTGYNELVAIYGRYMVVGSRIRVWAYNTCSSPVLISIIARGSTDPSMSSAAEVQQKSFERPDIARVKRLVPYGSGTSYPQCLLSMYKSMRSLEGRRYAGDDNYWATTGTVPDTETFWDVSLCSLDGAAVSSTSNCTVEITYYVRFDNMDIATTD